MTEADVPTPRTDHPVHAGLAGDHILRNRSVLGIGLGSLLSDTGHEMATAALPGFLSSIGAQATALGVIEGIADASLSASKVVGCVIADRPGVERKAVTAGGYAITALGHGAFALAESWPFVAVARAASWIARGARLPRATRCWPAPFQRTNLAERSASNDRWTRSARSQDRCSPHH